MNRRGFLGSLAAFAGTLALDPEKLLWRPGKLISIPRSATRQFVITGVAVSVSTMRLALAAQEEFNSTLSAQIEIWAGGEQLKIGDVITIAMPKPRDIRSFHEEFRSFEPTW
jgi:hypothetical protein